MARKKARARDLPVNFDRDLTLLMGGDFGTRVMVTPNGGAAFEINAIVTRGSEDANGTFAMMVHQDSMTLRCQVSAYVAGAGRAPNDRDQITISSEIYTVRNVREPDSLGLVYNLDLQRQ